MNTVLKVPLRSQQWNKIESEEAISCRGGGRSGSGLNAPLLTRRHRGCGLATLGRFGRWSSRWWLRARAAARRCGLWEGICMAARLTMHAKDASASWWPAWMSALRHMRIEARHERHEALAAAPLPRSVRQGSFVVRRQSVKSEEQDALQVGHPRVLLGRRPEVAQSLDLR